ncbi:hypothetical protein [Carnobacterium sp. ISL-102]|uniref:hypothetical protein n=1 Tax=Carnobacterium sp. ISL-102 TaxID=2819142 RepID=UPI001BEA411D|nr:hypothetical protein [Carnobacterium sp. ISL-102]MBT2732096.1 hypothetical protein [Carnobacterium sp. ISL-102]
MKQYAVYKGEDLLTMGTAKECGEELHVDSKTIYFYASQTHKKRNKGNRMVATLLEDDEE